MKTIALASCIGILAFASANAQELSHMTADIGGGFVETAGATGNYLNMGWNVSGGVGYKYSRYLGVNLDLGFNSLGVNGPTLATAGVAGGNIHVFTATIDPVVHLTPHKRYDLYVTGGGGLFHMDQQFNTPGSALPTGSLPVFGIAPGSFGANQVTSSYVVNRPGFDIGAGVAFGAFGHGKFYAEAKWDHMFLAGSHLDFIPVTFGYRW